MTLTYADLKQKRLVLPITELVSWDNNPRYIEEEDFEQLKKDISEEFKPMLVTPREDGKAIVIGGNMRLKAKLANGDTNAWVSVIDFKQEDQGWTAYVNGERGAMVFKSKEDGMLHYAIKDNESRGNTDIMKMQELGSLSGLNLEEYKIATLKPITLQALVDEVSPTVEEPKDNVPTVDKIKCPRCGLEFEKNATSYNGGNTDNQENTKE